MPEVLAQANDSQPTVSKTLRHAIEHAKHYLPTQGPISIFVHHNTLHAFEEMPFDRAVIEGGRRFGCQPYLSETRYHHELDRGRISLQDIREVLMDDLGDAADELIASFGTRYTLRLAMLQMTLHRAPEAELKWLLAETEMLTRFRRELSPQRREKMISQTRSWIMRHVAVDVAATSAAPVQGIAVASMPELARELPAAVRDALAGKSIGSIANGTDADWESVTLRCLWAICGAGVRSAKVPAAGVDVSPVQWDVLLMKATGEDIAARVNDVLIRVCGGYLDQGFADWSLPHREQGFAVAFASLYGGRWGLCRGWMKPLRAELRSIDPTWDVEASILRSLAWLGVPDDAMDEPVAEALLGLRGWAGMIWQMESTTPFLPHPIPKGSLDQYLAIRLMLQRHAIADVGWRHFRTRDPAAIRQAAELRVADRASRAGAPIDERTDTIFQLAQVGGWTPEQLAGMTPQQWTCLIAEVESFSSVARRRVLHAAYERHYASASLDAITSHCRRRQAVLRAPKTRPAYLAIFCIDDREESFRRHLEEIDPECQTASAAGFFAVAMYYRGADHAHYRPLCPAVVTPQHYVVEEPMFSAADESNRRAARRRQLGWFTHRVHSGSRTLIGGWFTGIFGAIATFPLVARIMAPRLTARLREQMSELTRPPATELHVERIAEQPGPDPDSLGYSVAEMAGIVVRILQDIGYVRDLPPIVVFLGHGSGSLNNPHESAYNCGACSGGRGGPNARAFAMMANDPRVRKLTAERGIELPDDVRFVGAYHNTCNDAVDYYDLDALPRSHRALFRRIESNMDETRARNAHERARRFESASLDLTPAEALEHVEERAEDLSQARPEYNHATNAMVAVGRRDWTRGLFMDRRVFLTQYDPSVDNDDAAVLTRILQAAIPVCAGISLEYYFSSVDVEGYGCGSKLPHNIVSMIGVMTGAASDLRPGLSQQMIEIHEPMRILFVIETTPEMLDRIIATNPGIAQLVRGNWVQLAVIDPNHAVIRRYENGRYVPHTSATADLPVVESSIQWYRGQRDHLGFASIEPVAAGPT